LGGTEDSLAYLRTEREYKNFLLVEQPNGDWAQTLLRQYLFSQYQYLLFQQLQTGKDEQIAAIAAKSLKEIGSITQANDPFPAPAKMIAISLMIWQQWQLFVRLSGLQLLK